MTALPDTLQTPDLQIEPAILSPRRRTRLWKWTGVWPCFPVPCWQRARPCARGFDCGEEFDRSTIIQIRKNHGIAPKYSAFHSCKSLPPRAIFIFYPANATGLLPWKLFKKKRLGLQGSRKWHVCLGDKNIMFAIGAVAAEHAVPVAD